LRHLIGDHKLELTIELLKLNEMRRKDDAIKNKCLVSKESLT
jgi:hypothetical protein